MRMRRVDADADVSLVSNAQCGEPVYFPSMAKIYGTNHMLFCGHIYGMSQLCQSRSLVTTAVIVMLTTDALHQSLSMVGVVW